MQIMRFIYHNSLLRFLFVGGIGLCTDACALYSFRGLIGLIPAKIVSYLIAYTVTWILNRIFTFHSKNPRRVQEWFIYTIIYSLTGVFHVMLFAYLVHHHMILNKYPIVALLITAAIISIINFLMSKKIVFKKVVT